MAETACGEMIMPNNTEELLRIAHEAFLAVRAECKSLVQQLETMTKDRDYYRDAYHHLLAEREV
jgi:hypothetical protein